MRLDSKQLTRLPFDQFSRQKRAAQVIDAVRKPGETFSILDVGGYKGATVQFHPADKVTILDVFDIKEKDYVVGDATNMTFTDQSFDFVVSFDVFEHIPRDGRKKFVTECARVAKRGVIIAAPVGQQLNAKAEGLANDLHKLLHQESHPWLKEHIDYKLPEPGLAKELLGKAGLLTTSFSSNYTPLWITMQSVIFGAGKFNVIGDQIDDLYEFYNTHLPSDGVIFEGNNYREIIVGLRDRQDNERLNKKVKEIFLDQDTFFEKVVEINAEAARVLVTGLNSLNDVNIENAKATADMKINNELLEKQNQKLAEDLDKVNLQLKKVVESKSYQAAIRLARLRHHPIEALTTRRHK